MLRATLLLLAQISVAHAAHHAPPPPGGHVDEVVFAGCVAGVTAAAWEIVPQLNEYLGLVPLPDDATRYTLLGLIAATLVGSLVWDRLCVLIFAPRIFKSQVDEIAALSIGDFWGPNSAKYCAAAIAGAAWLYYTEGNMLLLGMVYMLYRRTQTPAPGAPGAAPPQ